MKDLWNVLEIGGDMGKAQILFAQIEHYTLGGVEDDGIMKIFVNKESKDKITMIINELDYKSLHLTWNTIKNENWHLMWKKYFTPITVDGVIEILPDWNYDNISHKDKVFIRPGMSFGTGHHETTYLMIESLIEYSENRFSLLDLGSGSGILSIVGHKLGYRDIHAVEFDLECKDDFNFNLNINECARNINITWTNALKWKNFNFDLVIANIEKNIIKKIITNVKETSTRFIFSGLLKEDKEEMINHLSINNFSIQNINTRGEWIAINCKKNEN